MHVIEPFFSWRHYYIASEDPYSPFYGRTYSETEFTHAIYDYLIHPQWDIFGSSTLVSKILYVNYEYAFAVIELMGEWNDCLYNDIMFLKRNVIESLMENHINKFIIIGENVLNFHGGEDDYYEEWFEELEDGGYIFALHFCEHVIKEMQEHDLDRYIFIPEAENDIPAWRVYEPLQLKEFIESVNNLNVL